MTKSLFDEDAERDHAISAAAPDVIQVIQDRFGAWRIPSPETCFDGIIEGSPSPEEQKRMIQKALAARAVWKPSGEALALVETLRHGIGYDVLVEPWDPIMWMLPEEGPCPIVAPCIAVVVKKDSDGFEQAYLKLQEPREVAYAAGSPSLSDYLQADGDGTYLCNVGRLLRVLILGSRAS